MTKSASSNRCQTTLSINTDMRMVCVNEFQPLHMFLSGVGGTGKSFPIQAIKKQVAEIWEPNAKDSLTCAVAAPTKLAAFNVGGVTIHRLFQLPIEHEGQTAGYWSLPKASQKIMRTAFQHVKLFIFDEVSMLSSFSLAYPEGMTRSPLGS